jgi:hypothetical protein
LFYDRALLLILVVDGHNPAGTCAEKLMAAPGIEDKSDSVALQNRDERFLLQCSSNSDAHSKIWDASAPRIVIDILMPSMTFAAPVSHCKITQGFAPITLNQVSVSCVTSNTIVDEGPFFPSDLRGRRSVFSQ